MYGPFGLCHSVAIQFPDVFLAIFLYFEIIFGAQLYYAKLQIKFKFEGVSSILRVVVVLSDLEVKIISVSRCFLGHVSIY